MRISTVTVANEEGAFQATECLVQLGHKKIATITGPLHLTSAQDRLAGYKRALQAAKITPPAGYIVESTFERSGGHETAAALLHLKERPTAIFVQNDIMALGAILAIREAGLRCPQDVSLIGFDDLDVATLIDPPLSSIRQSGYELGQAGVALLLERVKGAREVSRSLTLRTHLCVRESVGRPKPAKPSRKREF